MKKTPLSQFVLPCLVLLSSSLVGAQESQNSLPEVQDFSGLFITMIFALVLVIGLAFILIKWLLPRLLSPKTLGKGGRLKVLERYGLEPRKNLYLVELEGRRLLLGASEQNLNLLAELSDSAGEGQVS